MAASKPIYSADPLKLKAANKASYSAGLTKSRLPRSHAILIALKKMAASCAYSKRSYAKYPAAKI